MSEKDRIQLLLHCEDGCVPFLNPSQLEKYFPPLESNLWLGLAVRDSCVAPILDSMNSVEGKNTRIKNSENKKNKVRGYTFARNKPDPWLQPYTRVTVPSFDLRIDEYNGKNSKGGNTSKNSNNAVLVWTPHGRQKLTPELYATASLEGLQSHHTLSLFDDIDKEDFSEKRKEKAENRNQLWFQHLRQKQESLASRVSDPDPDSLTVKEISKDSTVTETNRIHNSLIWKPVLLPHDSLYDLEPALSSSTSVKSENNSMDHLSGVAFVGRWRHGMQLKKIQKNMESIQWKVIMSTFSLSEILDIASEGTINVIGTNLPQKWAREQLALGLELDMVGITSDPTRENKRQKKITETTTTGSATQASAKILNADGCMDLSDKIYARDPNPLVIGCSCFACGDNRFSKAYVHHLVCAKEILAGIIIFGHNLHSLIQLVRTFDSNCVSPEVVNKCIRQQLPPK
mmetsp:Transcript_15631/g.15565  ORF Transcript_15631/g.15565 Transcript_15631/m.15565 type:complete len:457 (-) Transcript_15631:2289-3659(-)